jgi:hypothetical protein
MITFPATRGLTYIQTIPLTDKEKKLKEYSAEMVKKQAREIRDLLSKGILQQQVSRHKFRFQKVVLTTSGFYNIFCGKGKLLCL